MTNQIHEESSNGNLINLNFDEHLNIFWNYSGHPTLENNITKAIINFLQYSDYNTQFEVINFLINNQHSYDREKCIVKYGLQRYPDDAKKFRYKYLLGISPTGKEWSHEFVYLYNKDNCRELKSILTSGNEKKIHEYFEDKHISIPSAMYPIVLQEIEDIENKGGSIPDGWIMLYSDNTPYICIAIENKLWDLDPFQLRNHMEKSLGININFEEHKILKTYEDLYATIEAMPETFLRQNLMEFFYLLRYQPFRPFTKQEYKVAIDNPLELRFNILYNKWNLFFEKVSLECQYSINLERNEIWFNDIETGNITFSFENPKDNQVVSVASEIGVKHRYINEKIHKTLTDADIKVLDAHYKFADDFVIYARFMAVQQADYCDLEYFDDLSEALNNFVKKESIYISGMSKIDCLKFLDNCEYDSEGTKIKKYNHKEWDMLFYIRILTYVTVDQACCSYETLRDLFKEIFEKHRQGLLMFENIYRR